MSRKATGSSYAGSKKHPSRLRPYPPEHTMLMDAVAHKDAVVPELALDTKLEACHFPRRNRLLVRLSVDTLVIEA